MSKGVVFDSDSAIGIFMPTEDETHSEITDESSRDFSSSVYRHVTDR